MPCIELDGKQACYAGETNREGIPLIFCHGSGGGHHHWLYQLKGLADHVNPLAVDLPGHGRSEGPPLSDITSYANWLHRFANAIIPGPFVAAGHSMGGAIALDFALHYPDQTLGLILVGSGGRLRVLPELLETLSNDSIPKELADFLYGPAASEELREKGREEVRSTAPSLYYADLSACNKFDVMEELHRINKPVLMICGSEDRLTPVKYSLYLEEKLTRGQVEVVAGAGHMVMLEKPHEVNRAINQFIEELAPEL